MDKLAPKLIRRAETQKFSAVVVDPIYKVITGDENSAEQMAKFCNQFDTICRKLGAATIFCHHHSKGSQGNKQSMDRGSGSGVFARDPDAILDMIELSIDEDRRKVIQNQIVCSVLNMFMHRVMNNIVDNWQEQIPQDDQVVEKLYFQACDRLIHNHCKEFHTDFLNTVCEARQRAKQITGWRIEGTLREFPRLDTKNIFWDWPVHRLDEDHLLKDANPVGEDPPWIAKKKARAKSAQERKKEKLQALETAASAVCSGGLISLKDMAEYTGKAERTIRRDIKLHPDMDLRNGFLVWSKKGAGHD
jgi:RecA-family ATPase